MLVIVRFLDAHPRLGSRPLVGVGLVGVVLHLEPFVLIDDRREALWFLGVQSGRRRLVDEAEILEASVRNVGVDALANDHRVESHDAFDSGLDLLNEFPGRRVLLNVVQVGHRAVWKSDVSILSDLGV